MKKLFERLASPGRSEPRLTLAAFGKHPGWDDHIPGIGLETETLARLKQTLYVEGIGGQIDSGAWEKLEVDKRYDDFNHTFLWLYPDRLVLGLIWSSTDRKGRSKYPMVLGVEAQGVTPAFMVRAVQPGLCRLRDACRATSSPDEVERLCRAAQEQLSALLAAPPTPEHAGFTAPERRQQFIDHPGNGPDRLGLLRLLHELSLVPSLLSGRANGDDESSSRASEHLRLPLAATSADDSLLLWSGFLVCAVADTVPVLMMSRAGETYLEAIVGEPDPGDFFCLQTTPAAQPLVTTIPYQLAPTAARDLDAVLARFLDSRPAAATPAASKPPAVSAAPAPVEPKSEPGASKLIWIGLGLLLILAAAAAMLLTRGGKSGKSDAPSTPPPPAEKPMGTNASAPAQAVQNASLSTQDFSEATNKAALAFQAGEYSNALFNAGQALALQPNDATAGELKRKATEALLIASEVGKRSERHQSMARARAADKAEEWELAAREYQRAGELAAETKDNTASDEAGAAFEFASAMAAGSASMKSGDFASAILRADRALQLRPSHTAPLHLRKNAQSALAEKDAVAQRQQALQAATNAAAAALARNDFTNAILQADKALALNAGDPAATRLRGLAEQRIAALAQAERKRRLASDLEAARNLFANGDYAKTLALCAAQPDEPEFKLLAVNVRDEQASLETAQKRLAAGEYAALLAVKTNSCSSKPAFAAILASGAKEQQVLTTLEASRQTNGWQAVRDRLAAPEMASLTAKPPFAALRVWSEQQAKAASAAKPLPLEKLDEQLQILLVRFALLNPTAPAVTSTRAREERPYSGSLSPSAQQSTLKSIDWLEQEFTRAAALEQNDRKVLIQKLRERVRSWQ